MAPMKVGHVHQRTGTIIRDGEKSRVEQPSHSYLAGSNVCIVHM